MLSLITDRALKFAAPADADQAEQNARLSAFSMTGWMKIAQRESAAELDRIHAAAQRIRRESGALVLVGAGGSSLGARALISALGDGDFSVFFCGDNLSAKRMTRLRERLKTRDYSINIVSKTGTTLETLAAARVLLSDMEARYGTAAFGRVYVTAGEEDNALSRFARERECELFAIPRDVGGRYSVLSPAGLLPAAAAGVDIDALISGARDMAQSGRHTALRYAATRRGLYASGYRTEIFAPFEADLSDLASWWRQLFGESEGKGGGGIFPSRAAFTADLHSMGQYIQQGRRDIFETLLSVRDGGTLVIPRASYFGGVSDDLVGTDFAELNAAARRAVADAHAAGGVPVLEIELARLDAYNIGQAVYFFQLACAYSGVLSGINPFDQPGVESYKRKLKEILSNNRRSF
ncbi:MAG: glucose-6-phosphate isomerase [Oscillospiraceae bacterium]|jgi:glucose-6-phosphate isomerase|nr:glucose-6-phosphate isomerase [Oscillospiraceae bacterium]